MVGTGCGVGLFVGNGVAGPEVDPNVGADVGACEAWVGAFVGLGVRATMPTLNIPMTTRKNNAILIFIDYVIIR